MNIRGLGIRAGGRVFIRREHLWVRRGLVAAWLFDDRVGAFLAERGGRGGKGTLTAGAVWTRSPWGGAVDFPGSGARVSIPRAQNPRITQQWGRFTVMALVRPTSFGAGNLNRVVDLGAKTPAANSVGPWSFFLDNLTVASGLVLRVANLSGNPLTPGITDIKVANVVTLNTWQLLGFTMRRREPPDTSGWKATAYRDGAPMGFANSVRTGTLAMTQDPQLGAESDGQTAFIGQMAGAWIWEYGMTPGQVARFAADPFAAWRFDPTVFARPGASGPPAGGGGGVPAILRRRHGGL